MQNKRLIQMQLMLLIILYRNVVMPKLLVLHIMFKT